MPKYKITNRILHFIMLVGIVALLFSTSFLLTQHVTSDESAQLLVQQFGYTGILLISFITGLSMISPVPAATFTPIFTAGGINIITIIALAVVGTMLANFISYIIGRLGHDFTNTHYPKIQKRIIKIYTERKDLLPYLVFGFAAFIPLPDEIYLIPLGIIGVKIRDFIIPLFLGTAFFQTITAFGFNNIFQLILTW
jgi:membrane protein YqaA with SNARE-associated domain